LINLFKQCLIYLASARPIASIEGRRKRIDRLFPGPVSNAIHLQRAPGGNHGDIRNATFCSALLAPSTDAGITEGRETGLAVRLFHGCHVAGPEVGNRLDAGSLGDDRCSPICMVLAILRPRNSTGSLSWKSSDRVSDRSMVSSGTPVL